jgi:hypothetical protein
MNPGNGDVAKQKTPLRLMRESLAPPMTLPEVAAKVRGIEMLRGGRGKCSFGHLGGVERGAAQSSVRLLALLAEVYGCSREEVAAAYLAGRTIHQRRLMSKVAKEEAPLNAPVSVLLQI